MITTAISYDGSTRMPTPPELPEGSIWGFLTAGIAALLWLRSKFSRQQVDLSEDKAQISIIEVLQKERDQARQGEAEARQREDEAWRIRAEDAKLIGELTTQVKQMSTINKMLEQQVGQLRKELHKMREELAVFKAGEMVRQLKDGEKPE